MEKEGERMFLECLDQLEVVNPTEVCVHMCTYIECVVLAADQLQSYIVLKAGQFNK